MAKAKERRAELPPIPLDARTQQVIEEIRRNDPEKRAALIALLESWRHEETGITDEEWLEFRRSINENRGGKGSTFRDV
jgi:hypothetical protein